MTTRRTEGGRTIDRFTDPRTAEKRWRYPAAVGGVFVFIGRLVMVFPLVFGTAIGLVIGGEFLVTGAWLVWHAVQSEGLLRGFAVELAFGVFHFGVGSRSSPPARR
jgi:uncharacterized membrane protein HdeD (DUF308 family)